MFAFQRSGYLNSSLAQHAGKKQLKLKSPETRVGLLLLNAVVAVSRRTFKSNPLKVKLTFTAC